MGPTFMNSELKIQLFKVFWDLSSSSFSSFNSEDPSQKKSSFNTSSPSGRKGPRAELYAPALNSNLVASTYSYYRILSLQYIEMTFLSF